MPKSLSREAHHESRALLVGFLLILLVAAYFVGRAFWGNSDTSATDPAPSEEKDGEETQFIEPKVLFEKLQNNDPITLIDIRPREAYDAEHLPDSVSLSPGTLGNFPVPTGTVIVVVTSAEDPSSVELVQNVLSQKARSFFFLRGGLEAWKFHGYQTISAGDPNSFLDQSKVTYISPEELKALLTVQAGTDDVVLLDVQSETNFRKVHLVGAVNIPLADLERRKSEIPAAREIIVYGENELVSFQGGVRLSDLNFFAVRTLTGNDHLSSTSPLFREP